MALVDRSDPGAGIKALSPPRSLPSLISGRIPPFSVLLTIFHPEIHLFLCPNFKLALDISALGAEDPEEREDGLSLSILGCELDFALSILTFASWTPDPKCVQRGRAKYGRSALFFYIYQEELIFNPRRSGQVGTQLN